MSKFRTPRDSVAGFPGPPRAATSAGTVAWLHVPYAEKDQAKALGARWDPSARSWYVPAGRDLAPFTRWLPTEPAVDLDAPGPRLAVWVVGLADRCWKCQQPTVNVVGLLPQDAGEDELLTTDVTNQLAMAVATALLGEEARAAARVGAVKQRFSRTLGRSYLSNGCVACDALQGDFPLFHEVLPEVLAEGGLGSLSVLASGAVPVSLWRTLRSSGGDEREED
jgi:hypothetical protein